MPDNNEQLAFYNHLGEIPHLNFGFMLHKNAVEAFAFIHNLTDDGDVRREPGRDSNPHS